jgi:hypothetical protein
MGLEGRDVIVRLWEVKGDFGKWEMMGVDSRDSGLGRTLGKLLGLIVQ